MSQHHKQHPSKIRTFASDLNEARSGESVDITPSEHEEKIEVIKEEKNKTTLPKALAPKQTKAIKREVVPKEALKPKKEKKVVVPKKKVEEKKVIEKDANLPKRPIPAFHELNKKTDEQTVISNEAKKITDSDGKTQNFSHGATIITDNKRKRFKFFPAVGESISEWLKRLTKRRRNKAPQYVVPETSRREGVIQKATSKTGTIFTANNNELKEQILRRRAQASVKTTKNDEPETIWSPFTESGYDLLEAPDDSAIDHTPTKVKVEFKKHSQPAEKINLPTPVVPAPEIVVPEIKKPAEVEIPDKAEEEIEVETKLEPVIIVPEPIQEEEIAETPAAAVVSAEEMEITDESPRWGEVILDENPVTEIEVEVEPVTEVVDIQYPQKAEKTEASNLREFLQNFTTNTITLTLLTAIIICGASILLIKPTVSFITELMTVDDIEITINSEPILNQSNFSTITVAVNQLGFFSGLIFEAINSGPAGLAEYSLIAPNGNEVTASYIFQLLEFDTLPALRQALTTVHVAAVNQSKPMLVMQFVSKDTLRGGMLSWEDNIANDFADLYKIPADVQSIPLIDDIIDGIDVRVLKDENETYLIYGFISDNTLIIANQTTEFEQVLTDQEGSN